MFAQRSGLSQVLVMETCSGLVAGAVAERMGGHGTVCATWAGSRAPPLDVVRMFNFEGAVRDTICSASLGSLEAAAAQVHAAAQAAQAAAAAALAPAGAESVAGGTEAVQEHGTAAAAGAAANAGGASPAEAAGAPTLPVSATSPPADLEMEEAADAPLATVLGTDAAVGGSGSGPPEGAAAPGIEPAGGAVAVSPELGNSQPAAGVVAEAVAVAGASTGPQAEGRAQAQPPRPVPRNGRAAAPAAAPEQLQALLQRGGFGSCIVAAPAVAPLAAIQRLLPLLAPSATFVIFSNFLQPLTDAMLALQTSKAAVNLQLQVPR